MKIWQILKKENIGKIYKSDSEPSIKIVIREGEFDNKKEITAMTITEYGEQQTYFSINTSSLNIEFNECNKRRKNNEIPVLKLRRRKPIKEFVITYIIDYGFCGGYDADIETKVEIYRDEDEAYRRYYELQRKSDIYDVRLEGKIKDRW
ncbi:hypothetical protein G6Z34_13615 [Clostridium perfringens]|uniref:Uncharacterized protein n=1 Tax=Clostridium perfringens TaxID=1502 RepID=A0AAP6WP49_CLOPF|nr:hypothetical protein [Clostridium perfringens]NGU31124.1 hypothetical protein [Clostridium perfringens]